MVQFYLNGSTIPITINLTGTLKNDDVFCLSRSSASFSLLAYADQINSSSSWFDGNDAIVIRKGGANGQILDSLGQIGSSDYWGVDTTLRRKNLLLVEMRSQATALIKILSGIASILTTLQI